MLVERLHGLEIVSETLIYQRIVFTDPAMLKFKRKYRFKVCQFCNGHNRLLFIRPNHQKHTFPMRASIRVIHIHDLSNQVVAVDIVHLDFE